jgi:PKD repeat protein
MQTVSRALTALAATLVLFTAGCTVEQTQIPDLAGPSDFALSLNVTATPDTINQDGFSQSSVVVTARGPSGAPVSGVPVRLDLAAGGMYVDFGSLSTKSIVTNAEGRASAIYTAPPPPPMGTTGPFQVVTVVATPSSSNYQAAVPYSADIRLNTPGVILPPAGAPTASFTVSPASPDVVTEVFFDASGSTPGSGASRIVSYEWSFGDGNAASGVQAEHVFTLPGSYVVTLSVTNDRGISARTSRSVTVGEGTGPEADFVFSPAAPAVGQTVQFDGTTSTAAAGRSIVDWSWNFGDGSTADGAREDHEYDTAGTYNVVLTVTDDAGQEATISKPVTVGSGNPIAEFSFVVIDPVLHRMGFDGGASTATGSAEIVSYEWLFGDTTSGVGQTVQHDYGAANTYQVTLIVTDSLGRTGSTTKSVTVP